MMSKASVKTPAQTKPAPSSKSPATTVKEESKTLAVAENDLFFNNAGEGLENVTARDIIIPRIAILQALSPQVNAKKPEYIEGAKIGDICDLGTGELFEPPLIFIPVYYIKSWLEWAPRASGKGLIKIHADDGILEQCKPNDKNKPQLPNGNIIVETAQFYGLNASAGYRRSFLPMSSTQLKKAKRITTLASNEKLKRADGSGEYTPPLYYRSYLLSSVDEGNEQGDWSGWKVERGKALPEFEDWQSIFQEAKLFSEALKRGEMRGDLDRSEGDLNPDTDESRM